MQDPTKSVEQITTERPKATKIAVDKLTVYQEVQRIPPTKKLVKDIASKMDYGSLGVFHVSHRDDGTYSLIDGQRRKLALESLGLGSHKVDAMLYTGLSVAQEAALFRTLNRSRVVCSFDDFEKGVTAGDERDVGISKILSKIRWQAYRSTGPGKCSCVVSLRKVWDKDGNGTLLLRCLTALDSAFGRDKHTMSGSHVEGMASYLAANDVDPTTLVEKLRSKYGSPLTLHMAARSRRDVEGGSMSANVREIIARVMGSRKRPVR